MRQWSENSARDLVGRLKKCILDGLVWYANYQLNHIWNDTDKSFALYVDIRGRQQAGYLLDEAGRAI